MNKGELLQEKRKYSYFLDELDEDERNLLELMHAQK